MKNWLKTLRQKCIKLILTSNYKYTDMNLEMIDIEKIKIIKESKKGAALVEYNGKGTWLTPDLVSALKNGEILSDKDMRLELEHAINEAEIVDKEELAGKKPYIFIKGSMVEEREKAILWKCEGENIIWFPKSQIIISTDNEDEILVPLWLVKAKEEEEDLAVPKNVKKIWR